MLWSFGNFVASLVRSSGLQSISSVFPRTPSHPRSRIRSTTSAGWGPFAAKSPPCKTTSGELRRKSARTASRAVRLPWMSDTIAVRMRTQRRAHQLNPNRQIMLEARANRKLFRARSPLLGNLPPIVTEFSISPKTEAAATPGETRFWNSCGIWSKLPKNPPPAALQVFESTRSKD